MHASSEYMQVRSRKVHKTIRLFRDKTQVAESISSISRYASFGYDEP